jgi:hypothetical protein
MDSDRDRPSAQHAGCLSFAGAYLCPDAESLGSRTWNALVEHNGEATLAGH